MTDEKTVRQQLVESLNQGTRQMSTWTILYHSAIAGQVGLNVTDHKCLDILNHQGSLTAGQLAGITGLTTGAVTGVIDRLEKAGYVRRMRDPGDRRRVIIQPAAEKAAQDFGPLFAHLQACYLPLLEHYSEDDLRLLFRFVQDSIQVLQAEIDWLRKEG